MSPRHHRQLRRGLHALVDGEAVDEGVDEPSRPTLIAHLDECDGCQDELGLLRSLKASLQRIGRQRPTPLAVARLDRWSIDRLT